MPCGHAPESRARGRTALQAGRCTTSPPPLTSENARHPIVPTSGTCLDHSQSARVRRQPSRSAVIAAAASSNIATGSTSDESAATCPSILTKGMLPAGRYNVRAPRATASPTQSSKLNASVAISRRRCSSITVAAVVPSLRSAARAAPALVCSRWRRESIAAADLWGFCRGAEFGDQVSRRVPGGNDVASFREPAQPDDQLVVQPISPHLDGLGAPAGPAGDFLWQPAPATHRRTRCLEQELPSTAG